MKFSTLLTVATATLFAQCQAAPAQKDNKKREDPIVIHLTSTKQNTLTNTHTVEGTMSTFTDLQVNTATETYTHYTATVTSTVFGTPHTYTTVASTPIQNNAAGSTGAPAPQETTADDSPSPTDLAPAITPQAATTSGSWIIENVTTATSNSVCVVNYDYYYASESGDDETVTSTSTVTKTITQA